MVEVVLAPLMPYWLLAIQNVVKPLINLFIFGLPGMKEYKKHADEAEHKLMDLLPKIEAMAEAAENGLFVSATEITWAPGMYRIVHSWAGVVSERDGKPFIGQLDGLKEGDQVEIVEIVPIGKGKTGPIGLKGLTAKMFCDPGDGCDRQVWIVLKVHTKFQWKGDAGNVNYCVAKWEAQERDYLGDYIVRHPENLTADWAVQTGDGEHIKNHSQWVLFRDIAMEAQDVVSTMVAGAHPMAHEAMELMETVERIGAFLRDMNRRVATQLPVYAADLRKGLLCLRTADAALPEGVPAPGGDDAEQGGYRALPGGGSDAEQEEPSGGRSLRERAMAGAPLLPQAVFMCLAIRCACQDLLKMLAAVQAGETWLIGAAEALEALSLSGNFGAMLCAVGLHSLFCEEFEACCRPFVGFPVWRWLDLCLGRVKISCFQRLVDNKIGGSIVLGFGMGCFVLLGLGPVGLFRYQLDAQALAGMPKIQQFYIQGLFYTYMPLFHVLMTFCLPAMIAYFWAAVPLVLALAALETLILCFVLPPLMRCRPGMSPEMKQAAKFHQNNRRNSWWVYLLAPVLGGILLPISVPTAVKLYSGDGYTDAFMSLFSARPGSVYFEFLIKHVGEKVNLMWKMS